MNIYLAARYSRRLELCEYRRELERRGHRVIARWLDGSHQITADGKPVGEDSEALIEGDDNGQTDTAARLRERFALEDIGDLEACELCICFTEPTRSGHSRGGRHVEMGYAIAANKEIWVVGHRENLFCWLPTINFFEHFTHCLGHLSPVL